MMELPGTGFGFDGWTETLLYLVIIKNRSKMQAVAIGRFDYAYGV